MKTSQSVKARTTTAAFCPSLLGECWIKNISSSSLTGAIATWSYCPKYPTTQEDAYDLWQCTAPLASAITNIVSSPQIFTKYTASEVIPSFLYLGNATDASNLEWFQKTSITHVLNCADSTASGEGDVVHKLKLNYCQLDAGSPSSLGALTLLVLRRPGRA